MKRSFRETINNKAPAEDGIRGNVQEIVDRYSGMSEDQLMSALLAETSKQKKEGRFDKSQVENGISAILPMLSEEQKRKLSMIMGRIDRGE